MFLSKAKELRERRAKLVADAQELLKKEQMTAEDRTKFDSMMADADGLKADIDRHERADRVEEELRATVRPPNGAPTNDLGAGALDEEARKKAGTRALRRYLLAGEAGLTPEDRTYLRRDTADVSTLHPELRDLGIGAGATGGYFVPQGFVYEIEQALKMFGGMRKVATALPTATGNQLPYPTDNDTANMGEIVGEGVAVSYQDVALGQVIFGAYKYSTKALKVSIELLQDSAFDIETYLRQKMTTRLGRIQNNHFTLGTGAGQPRGITLDATLGKQGVAGQTTSVIYDDLVDLIHSVDPAYRDGAKWMMHDSSIKVIKKLKDTQGHPLWQPGVALREPDTLLGYQYEVNQDVPIMAVSAKSILFGQLSKYTIRDVRELSIIRLNERYAENGQVAFIGFSRQDGKLLDAGTHPVAYYQNSAT